MGFGQQLQDWLSDRERQRETQTAIDLFARRWNEGAVQQRFNEAMMQLPGETAEAAANAARHLFADDGWVDAVIGQLVEQLHRDPFFDPPFRAINSDIHSGLIVFEDERLSIGAGITGAADLAAKKNAKRGATSVGFSGRVSVLKFVKAGGASISLWEAPPITAAFTAAKAGRCVRAGARQLADGDILTIDGRHQGFVIERAHGNLLVLQAEISLDAAPLSVEYDSETHAFVGCSATSDGASRIQMLATLLRKLGSEQAFPAIAAFVDHQDFFVRWHVMRELLGIDAEAGLPRLKRMAAHDPHDDVRRAARSVLDRLQAPAQPSKAA